MKRKFGANYIKTVIIDYLIENYDVELLACEVPYLYGYRRADLLSIINNETVAFEIKSELDSLNKLEGQLNDYIDVFNKVYVVLANKFKNKFEISKLPQTVGVIFIDNNLHINIYRNAKTRKILNKEKLIYLFNKNEMNTYNNIDKNLSLNKTRLKFLKNNTIHTIIEYSKITLRNKYAKQYKKFILEKGNYTIEDDLLLLTGINKDNYILENS